MAFRTFKALAAIAALMLILSPAAAQLVIGQVASFDNPDTAGPHIRAGWQTYFNAVNHAGGVYGARLKFVSKDRGRKATESVVKTREFVKEFKPLVLAGLMGTGSMKALVKSGLLEEEGIAVVGIRTGAVALHEPVSPYLFHTRANYLAEIEKIVTQLATVGLNRVAVFHEKSAFGQEGLALVKRTMQAQPAMRLVQHATYPANTNDVADAVRAIHAANPQGIIVIANSTATAEFYKAYRVSEGKAQVLALSVTDGVEVVKRIGKQHARGLIVAQVVPDPANLIPLIREFHTNFKKFAPPGTPVNQADVEGYLAGKTTVEALRIAGPNPTRQKVHAALESMKEFDAGGVIIGFSQKSHTGSKYVELAIVLASGKIMR